MEERALHHILGCEMISKWEVPMHLLQSIYPRTRGGFGVYYAILEYVDIKINNFVKQLHFEKLG